jgi:hypothetical protein
VARVVLSPLYIGISAPLWQMTDISQKKFEKKIDETGNQPQRDQSGAGIQYVDEVAHAHGDVCKDIGCQPLGKGQQADRHQVQHTDVLVHR